jgi:hypothetical protein
VHEQEEEDDEDEDENEDEDEEEEGVETESDTSDGWLPDAPVPTPGHWVVREEFRGRKSFGFFLCDCGKQWGSAHSFPDYTQGCQTCEDDCFPRWLWVNTVRRDPITLTQSSVSPHDRTRCAACHDGKCLAANDFDNDWD